MRVVDYETVLAQAAADGLRCVYPMSGAFLPSGPHQIVGWVGPDDPTIRADLPGRIVRCPAPHAANLSAKLVEVWQRDLPTAAWVLPKSHWSYELTHAHQDWLLEILGEFGIDAAWLAARPGAAAIEFLADDARSLQKFVETLLNGLKTSDYAILSPGTGHVVTLHHHQQLWWQTSDAALADRLAGVAWPLL